MGTDITLFAERHVLQAWQPVPEPQALRGQLFPIEPIDFGRPYELFSLLSGSAVGMNSKLVELPPFFSPRGFPKDMSPLYKELLTAEYEKYGKDVNWGLSWLELQEIIELEWERCLKQHAYVEEQYVEHFRSDQPYPESFPKDGKLYHGLIGPPPDGTRKVEWTISIREFVGCSEWFIEQLVALAAGDKLRIIYWFGC